MTRLDKANEMGYHVVMATMITDELLVNAAYRGRSPQTGEKIYRAVYADGTAVVLALNGNIRAYSRIASEYGVRFLGGTLLVTVERIEA